MTFTELKEQITQVSSIESDERLNMVIKLAVNELWYGVDLPSTTRQMYIKDESHPLITLPPEVHLLRAVKRVMSDNVELNTPMPFYQQKNLSSEYHWQVLGQTALQKTIRNATPLTFSLAEEEATDISITVNGRSRRARSLAETVTIMAGDTGATSVHAYEDVPVIQKDRATNSDVLISVEGEITDPDDDAIIGRIFNHELESPCLQVNLSNEINSPSYQAGNGCPFHCFNIIYRERPPSIAVATAIFPAPYDQALLLKCLAYAKLVDGLDMETLNAKGAEIVRLVKSSEQVALTQRVGTSFKSSISGCYGSI